LPSTGERDRTDEEVDGRAIDAEEYCQIEKLANLDQLPAPFGFYVSCLPVKIKDASAGWRRAVALVPM